MPNSLDAVLSFVGLDTLVAQVHGVMAPHVASFVFQEAVQVIDLDRGRPKVHGHDKAVVHLQVRWAIGLRNVNELVQNGLKASFNAVLKHSPPLGRSDGTHTHRSNGLRLVEEAEQLASKVERKEGAVVEIGVVLLRHTTQGCDGRTGDGQIRQNFR